MRTQRDLLQFGGGLRRQIGGEDFARPALLILRFVVEDLALDDDFTYRQRLSVENSDGELTAGNELLDHDFVVEASGPLDGFCEVARLADDGQSDGGSLLVRFHDNGPAQGLAHIVREHRRHQPSGGRHACGAKQPLGEIFVHRRRAGDVITACVGQAGEIEHRLNPPVLPRSAVQRKKHDIDIAYVRCAASQGKSGFAHGGEHGTRWRLWCNAAGK